MPQVQESVLEQAEKEVWKAIKDFPGYEVSNYGRVRSFWKPRNGIVETPQRILVLKIGTDGYYNVNLHKNKRIHSKVVHRLVLETFLGSCPIGMESCHNDGSRTKNHVSNLRWDTRKNNQGDRHKHGTATFHKKKLNTEQIRHIRLLSAIGYSQVKIAAMYKMSRTGVLYIVNHRTHGDIT